MDIKSLYIIDDSYYVKIEPSTKYSISFTLYFLHNIYKEAKKTIYQLYNSKIYYTNMSRQKKRMNSNRCVTKSDVMMLVETSRKMVKQLIIKRK
ncbi:MAG: hypothetical protein C0597_07115 [Marinilabiliales bacterium]|nr:MAG: hypothetical protein C0597_07115 [Marinilabiliales bacterium]